MAKAKPTTGLGRKDESVRNVEGWLYDYTGDLGDLVAESGGFVESSPWSSRTIPLADGEELVSYAVRKADGSIDVRPA